MLAFRGFGSPSFRLLAIDRKAFGRNFSDIKKEDNDSNSATNRKTGKESKQHLVKKETAADRLNKLLSSMHTDDNITQIRKVNMAKPGVDKRIQNRENDSKNVLQSLKKVASHLGEESKQLTESELLNKLLMHSENSSVARSNKEEKSIDGEVTLSDLIVGMKIDRRQPEVEYSRGEYVRKTLANRSVSKSQSKEIPDRRRERNQPRQPEPNTGSVNLFGSEDLGVFKKKTKPRPFNILRTWEDLYEHDLMLCVAHPPTNFFQRMAIWTEQCKLWKFPIDNEQGLDKEAATDFSEHVLLEQHLEHWCPKKGPIRHYMELVCVGLAKNPYISAREKKEHILWYREYFNAKKDLIKEVIIDNNDSPIKDKMLNT